MLPCKPLVPGSVEDSPAGILVGHRVTGFSERWTIGDVPVPEREWHYDATGLFQALIKHWIARTGKDAAAFCNLAIRVDRDRPQVGMDPDLAFVTPAPPDTGKLSSLRLWEPGHAVPALVLEVVSPGHPYKDYAETPDRCAALGVRELILFDPMRAGPKTFGRPSLVQIWRRTEVGAFLRVESTDGAAFSEVLGAYVIPDEASCRLRIADDDAGERPWLTAGEAERERADAERRRADAAVERAETALEREERALARIRELEDELRRRG